MVEPLCHYQTEPLFEYMRDTADCKTLNKVSSVSIAPCTVSELHFEISLKYCTQNHQIKNQILQRRIPNFIIKIQEWRYCKLLLTLSPSGGNKKGDKAGFIQF